MSGVKDGEELNEGDPIPFYLSQNYPNPFNPSTEIRYDVSTPINLTINIYTEDWFKVSTIVNRFHQPGSYAVTFNGLNKDNEQLPTGDYYYTLEGRGYILVRMMRLIK
jgi:hypothetical protein